MKVSIITPAYNQQAFIRQCLDSVLAQTHEDWEQIVVDDCSPDRTADIVRSYGDPRIRLHCNASRNGVEDLHRSYNAALALATGEIVAVLEGDDHWPAEKLSKQLPAFEKPSVVLSWGTLMQDFGNPAHANEPTAHRIPRSEFSSDTEWLLLGNSIGAATVMARTDALRQVGGFYQVPGTVYVDYSTWLRLSTLGEFRFVPEVLGYWRQHSGQTTRTKKEAVLWSEIAIVEDFLRSPPLEIAPQIFALHSARVRASLRCRRAMLHHLRGYRMLALGQYLRALPSVPKAERWFVVKAMAKAIIGRSAA